MLFKPEDPDPAPYLKMPEPQIQKDHEHKSDPIGTARLLMRKKRALLKDLYTVFFAEECQRMWEPLVWRDADFQLLAGGGAARRERGRVPLRDEAAAFGQVV